MVRLALVWGHKVTVNLVIVLHGTSHYIANAKINIPDLNKPLKFSILKGLTTEVTMYRKANKVFTKDSNVPVHENDTKLIRCLNSLSCMVHL